METYQNKAPEEGQRIAPLSGGAYRRDEVGTVLTVGRIDWERGLIYARENPRNGAHGWRIDPRPLGQPRTRPYISMSDPYVVGLEPGDVQLLNRMAERKQELRKTLREYVTEKETEIQAKFMARAAKIQAAIDARGGQVERRQDAEILESGHASP